MVRFWRYSIVLGILLVLMLWGAASWLLYSPSGTRWVFSHLPEWTGTELSIGRIEGTLGGVLELQDIALQQEGMRLRLAELSMENHLIGIFPPGLEIIRLQVEHLQIETASSRAEKPPQDLHWPQLPWPLEILEVTLDSVELRDLSWQQDNQAPQRIELLRGELHWSDGRLEGEQLLLQSTKLQGSGSFTLGLSRPLLKVISRLSSGDAQAPWQQLVLQADLQPGATGQLLHGPVSLDLTATGGERLTATAELGLTTEQLVFRQLQLRRSGRPGQITASGSLSFSGAAPELSARLQLDRLDLAAETGQPLRLSGSLEVRGGLEAYTGRFELNNQGTDLTTASLAGKFNGDRQKLALSDLQGQWLSGRLGGQLQLGWEQGWQAQAQLTGSDLDPRLLSPQLSGQLSPQLLLDFQQTGPGKRSGRLQLYLGESMLHGQPLTGEALLQLQDNVLRVEKLQLLGDGLALQASGNPGERLKFHGQIDRLEQLLSETAGRISADGWLRWRQQTLVMEFHAAGKQLAFREWRLADLALRGGTEDSGKTWRLQLAGQQLQTPPAGSTIDRVKLELQGTLAEHQLTLNLSQGESRLAAGLQGGWDQHQWQGKLTRFQGDDARFGSWLLGQSAPLMISPALVRVGPLLLRDNKGGEVALHGSYQPSSQQADGELRWQALDLGMLRPWLADWRISGQSSGSLELRREPQHVFHGDISFSGELQRQLQLKLSQSQMILDWDQQGLRSSLQLQLVDGGSLHGTMTSADPATLALPQQAELQLTGDEIPLVLFRPWLPPELNVSGKLSITASGSWQAGESPNLEGSAKTAEARLSWLEDEGVIGTDISATSLSWHWRDRLQGTLELKLKESGNIESRFDLPLPARLPLSFAPDEKLTAELQARLQELGLLSVLFPGRIQESRGHLKLDLQLAGTVRQPSLLGNFHLFDAAAFIPAAGVQLEKIDLQGDFADHQIRLAQLQIKSGGGRLQGNGELELQNWRPGIYRLQLKGENFQLIHLPDLQVSSNPDLQIEGTTEKIKVRGQVKFPDALIKGQQKTALASNSPDLQIVDQKSPAPRQAKLQHDIDVQLLLGDRVLLNTAGIDARLEGSLRLQSTSQQELAANGEIHVAKGKYASYGVSLDITRGNLYFTGGPLDQPALDILALRTAGEVKAGVKVTGTPQVPVVQLYSEPPMADTDILSYIVLGHPIGANGSQSGMLLTAAGALLSQGESVSLQEKLKSRLGLDVLDISAGNGDVNSSIITTGKYLSPELYISLGYSLFTNTNELKVRYNLTPSWELESSIGVESGVDMFYRIEIE